MLKVTDDPGQKAQINNCIMTTKQLRLRHPTWRWMIPSYTYQMENGNTPMFHRHPSPPQLHLPPGDFRLLTGAGSDAFLQRALLHCQLFIYNYAFQFFMVKFF